MSCLSYRHLLEWQVMENITCYECGARDIAHTVVFNAGLDITHEVVLTIARRYMTIV